MTGKSYPSDNLVGIGALAMGLALAVADLAAPWGAPWDAVIMHCGVANLLGWLSCIGIVFLTVGTLCGRGRPSAATAELLFGLIRVQFQFFLFCNVAWAVHIVVDQLGYDCVGCGCVRPSMLLFAVGLVLRAFIAELSVCLFCVGLVVLVSRRQPAIDAMSVASIAASVVCALLLAFVPLVVLGR